MNPWDMNPCLMSGSTHQGIDERATVMVNHLPQRPITMVVKTNKVQLGGTTMPRKQP